MEYYKLNLFRYFQAQLPTKNQFMDINICATSNLENMHFNDNLIRTFSPQ